MVYADISARDHIIDEKTKQVLLGSKTKNKNMK